MMIPPLTTEKTGKRYSTLRPFHIALEFADKHPGLKQKTALLQFLSYLTSVAAFELIYFTSPGFQSATGALLYLAAGIVVGGGSVGVAKAGLRRANDVKDVTELTKKVSRYSAENKDLRSRLEDRNSGGDPLVKIGKKRIERLLGVGGMAVVYSFLHERFNKRFAIKFPRPDALENPIVMARFEKQETQRMDRLREVSGVVRIHEAGEITRAEYIALMKKVPIPALDGQGVIDIDRVVPEEIKEVPYIVLDLIPGGGRTLDDLMIDYKDHQGRRMPMPWTDVLTLAFDIAQTMYLIDQQGIIHRDIKPANVFVFEVETKEGNRRRETRLGDFGIATETSPETGRQTTEGTISGTCGYGPLEQMILGAKLDSRADQHAFGAMLFEMLTAGQLPYAGDDNTTILNSMMKDPPRRLSAFRKSIGIALPSDFQLAIMKMINKEANDRFPDSLAVVAKLYEIAGKHSIPVFVRDEVALALHRRKSK
ncbi:serine/threonine protein kinase [Candidatus Saganbacteria bacterium]|nr:serine/threonine protein kinase [Candidatus Saganbacteria bacterium]